MALLASAAHLIKPDGREIPDQRISSENRKQKRKSVLSGSRGIKENADHEIDNGKEKKMGRHGAEIAEPFTQRIAQV